MNADMKFAVLIDGDNVAPKYLKAILDEVADNGVATYKRVYTDWTQQSRSGWKKIMLEHSVMPVQQYSYTTGKNSTDSAMIIDAMDILYTGNVDGFYLATSDSDFTRLAARLREAGKYVVGVGEAKTPSAFRSACNSFKLLEVISGSDDAPTEIRRSTKGKKKEYALTPLDEIENSIYKIIDENSNRGKDTYIGEIGSRLMNKHPDFDVRNYGCTKLLTFLEDKVHNLVLQSKNSSTMVSIRKEDISRRELEEKLISILQSNGGVINNMAVINEELKVWNPSFSAKKLGYSKFSAFLQSFDDLLEIDADQNSVRLIASGKPKTAGPSPAKEEDFETLPEASFRERQAGRRNTIIRE
ncbi:MAG: NYN domain-containing protein [Lachnospiraceae bacterium]|nr:NYN domain-containing protein [Lachnospiraceae bacterium]